MPLPKPKPFFKIGPFLKKTAATVAESVSEAVIPALIPYRGIPARALKQKVRGHPTMARSMPWSLKTLRRMKRNPNLPAEATAWAKERLLLHRRSRSTRISAG